MNKLIETFISLILLLFIPAVVAEKITEIADFGVLYNDDGWSAIGKDSPQASMTYLTKMVSELPELGIDTLMYCTGVSDVLKYPTKVASPFGWNGIKKSQYQPFKDNIDAGVDGVMVAGKAANKAGINFFVSYRMNDNHFISRPDLRSEFYLANNKTANFSIGKNPYPNIGIDFGKMPSYANEKVRQFRLAIIKEHISHYGQVMDGLELDFSRLAIMFPDNTGWENRALITDIIQQTRTELDNYASKLNKHLYLAVRIPPSRKNSEWAGIDVMHWIENNLVDLVIPSQNMTTVMAMPIDDIIAAGKQHNVGIYAGVYQRSVYSFPFKSKAKSRDYFKRPSRDMTAAMMRGATNNYRFMGANNMQLFNILLPFNKKDLALVDAVANEQTRFIAPRVYAITPSYWFDYGPEKISYKKQLPQKLNNKVVQSFDLFVGENFAETKPDYVGLRFGFNGKADKVKQLTLHLNGQKFFQAKPKLLKVIKPKTDKNSPPAVHYYFQIELEQSQLAQLIKAGKNALSIAIQTRLSNGIVLSEVQLGVMN